MSPNSFFCLFLISLCFLAIIHSHPSCVPKNSGDPLTFPSVPHPPLQLCLNYNEWPGACCSHSNEPTAVQYNLEHLVNPSTTPADCMHNLQVIHCSVCDPYSAHLFESPTTPGTLRTFSVLCHEFCTRVWESCANVTLDTTYALRMPGVPVGNGFLKLSDLYSNADSYCNQYASRNSIYCLTDNPSEIPQPSILPGMSFPIENAFPNLNLDTDDIRGPRTDIRNHITGMFQFNDGTGRWAVCFQHGIIVWFENDPNVSEYHLFADFRGMTAYLEPSELAIQGIAFHPHFKDNGYVFVKWNPRQYALRLSRFTFNFQTNQLDMTSELNLFEIGEASLIHHGGPPVFDKDGLMLLPMGDGIDFTENFVPYNTAPDMSSLSGKVLRLDVDSRFPGLNYGIPTSNPFYNRPGVRWEIYAYGLRNPWSFKYDKQTGRTFFGDVGQATWEEINELHAGANYGWHKHEGNDCYYPGPQDCIVPNETKPLVVYPHDPSRCSAQPCLNGNSIMVGGIYRGSRVPALHGNIIFADYTQGTLYAMSWNENNPYQNVIARLDIGRGLPDWQCASFAVDENNELYLLNWYKPEISVFKRQSITPPVLSPPQMPIPPLTPTPPPSPPPTQSPIENSPTFVPPFSPHSNETQPTTVPRSEPITNVEPPHSPISLNATLPVVPQRSPTRRPLGSGVFQVDTFEASLLFTLFIVLLEL